MLGKEYNICDALNFICRREGFKIINEFSSQMSSDFTKVCITVEKIIYLFSLSKEKKVQDIKRFLV